MTESLVRPLAVTAHSTEERTALAHLRGECHNSDDCPVCDAFADGVHYGRHRAIHQVACG